MDASQAPAGAAQVLEPTKRNGGDLRALRGGVPRRARRGLGFSSWRSTCSTAALSEATLGGRIDSVGRVANVSRGEDLCFDAAIIGKSHLMPLEPKRLSAATGFSFVHLAVPAERKREDAAMIAWFRRNHPKIAALVINADPTICDRDPTLPLTAPFPFWLYGSDLGYLAHMMSASMLRLSVKRIKATLGLSATSDPSGTTFEEVKFAFAGPPPSVRPPATDLSPALLGDAHFPAIDLMGASLDGLPSSTVVVFVIPPTHVSLLPPQNTPEWREIKTCKYELERRVRAHANWRSLDYFLDTPAVRDTENFIDPNHYRTFFSRMIENDIAASLKAASTTALDVKN